MKMLVVKTEQSEEKDINKINLAAKFKSFNQCKLCYQKCDNKESLKRHEEVVHKDDVEELSRTCFYLADLKFPCDKCKGVKFLTERVLMGHKRMQHGDNSMACPVCQKVVKHRYNLKKHLKSHKIKGQKGPQCKLCYKRFKLAHFLQSHQVSVHADDAEFLNKDITEEDKKYPCNSCELRFVSEACMKLHSKGHSLVQLKCFFCEDRFSCGNDRNKHCLKIHGKQDEPVGSKKVKCMICTKVVSRKVLQCHRRTHTSLRIEECILCYTKFKYKSSVRKHIKLFHDTEEEMQFLENGKGTLDYECEVCKLKFLTSKLLLNHRNQCQINQKKQKPNYSSKKTKSRCKLCYLVLKRTSLMSHVERVHPIDKKFLEEERTENDMKFHCSSCDKKYVSQTLLDSHTRHHEREDLEFLREKCLISNTKSKCSLCYTEYKYFSELTQHIRNNHRDEMDYFKRTILPSDLVFTCEECQEGFVTENSMLYHRVRGHYSDSEDLFCKICDSSLKTAAGAFRHKMLVHKDDLHLYNQDIADEDKVHKCHLCENKYAVKSSLKWHLNKMHSCEKFRSKSSKDRKQKKGRKILISSTKSVEKTVQKCKLCHTRQTNMKRHIERVHSDDKHFLEKEIVDADLKYECDLCVARFISKNSQEHHKSLHAMETKCFYCDFVADNLKGFQKHCLEVHGKQDEDMGDDKVKCMFCEKILKKSAIYSHRQFHMDDPIQCKICYVSAKSKHSLYYHVREVHKTDLEKSFLERGCPADMLTESCENCELKFLTDKLLQNSQAISSSFAAPL